MDRHEEIKRALLAILSNFGPGPVGMYAIGVPLISQGYTQSEIYNSLVSLELEEAIDFLPDNQLLVLRPL